MYPNTVVLFGDAPKPVKEFFSNIIDNQLLPNGVASPFNLAPSNSKDKVTLVNIMRSIRQALALVDSLCRGCSGDHRIWWLAGGAAAFLKKKTNSFGDCDVYICCDGKYCDPPSFLNLSDKYSSNYMIAGRKLHVLNVQCEYLVQIIPVTFSAPKFGNQPLNEGLFSTFQDLFGMYILSSFDLPVCRVALKFNVKNTTSIATGQEITCRCLDLSCFEVVKIRSMISLSRIAKYKKRQTVFQCNMCSLKEVVIFQRLLQLVDAAYKEAESECLVFM